MTRRGGGAGWRRRGLRARTLPLYGAVVLVAHDGDDDVEEEEGANGEEEAEEEEGEARRLVRGHHHVRVVGRRQADEELPRRLRPAHKVSGPLRAWVLGGEEDDADPAGEEQKGAEDDDDPRQGLERVAHQPQLVQHRRRVAAEHRHPQVGCKVARGPGRHSPYDAVHARKEEEDHVDDLAGWRAHQEAQRSLCIHVARHLDEQEQVDDHLDGSRRRGRRNGQAKQGIDDRARVRAIPVEEGGAGFPCAIELSVVQGCTALRCSCAPRGQLKEGQCHKGRKRPPNPWLQVERYFVQLTGHGLITWTAVLRIVQRVLDVQRCLFHWVELHQFSVIERRLSGVR